MDNKVSVWKFIICAFIDHDYRPLDMDLWLEGLYYGRCRRCGGLGKYAPEESDRDDIKQELSHLRRTIKKHEKKR